MFSLAFQAVTKIYLNNSLENTPLERQQVEQVIADTAMTFYDNASNCNRTRGGMKKASDMSVIHTVIDVR